MSNPKLAYFLARLTLGINFLMHGLIRIPKLNEFAAGMVKEFGPTYLPLFVVKIFGHTLPFIELLIGLFLILGFQTRKTLTATAILLMILIFGTAFRENWALISQQMLYALFVFFMILYVENNVWAIDIKTKNNIDGFTSKK